MKKLFAILLVLVMMLGIVACTPANTTTSTSSTAAEQTPPASTAMTHAEFLAAAKDDAVEIECYVQATQSFYNNAIKIYAQDKTGGYFCYDIPCTAEQAAKLVPGTKINIKGFKTFYKDMPEVDAKDAVLTILEGADTYIATAEDMTALLGKQELVNKTGMLAAFKGLTVTSISFKESDSDRDIYVGLSLGDQTFDFCVERWLTGPDTEVYQTCEALQVGDVIDIEGFVYWYDADEDASGDGINTHITKVTKAG